MNQFVKNATLYVWACLIPACLLAQSYDSYDIGVVVHIIGGDNGEGALSEATALASVQRANTDFTFGSWELNLFVVKIIHHNDNDLTNLHLNDLPDFFLENNLYVFSAIDEKAVNLYFVETLSPAALGYASLPPNRGGGTLDSFYPSAPGIIVKNDYALASTITHEFGHFFGLYHTYEVAFGEDDGDHPCTQYGDLLCDTAPEPAPPAAWGTDGEYWNQDPSDPYWPEIDMNRENFMSGNYEEYRNQFSQDQRTVMKGVVELGDREDLIDQNWLQVINEINETNAGGELQVGTVTYASGEYFWFEDVATFDIRTKDERLQQTYKHHDWNNDGEVFQLLQTGLQVNSTTPPQKAKFMSMATFSIENNFFSGNGNGEDIKFKDPWYVDSTGNQPNDLLTFESPYHATGSYSETSGGVFVGQEPHPSNPDIPFYSAKALETTIDGVEYHFTHWSGSNVTFGDRYALETSIVMGGNSNAVANFKGKGVSNSSSATNGSSARKIVHYSNSTWYAVYVDDGQVYLSKSTNNGSDWLPEEWVSDGVRENNTWPTICVDPVVNDQITVFWSATLGSNYYVFWRRMDVTTGEWGEIGDTYSHFISFDAPTKPSAVYRNGIAYCLARAKDEITEIEGLYLFSLDAEDTFTRLALVDNTNGNSDNPSLAVYPDNYYNSTIHCAWDQSNEIHYAAYNIGTGEFENTEDLTEGTGLEVNSSPSISCNLDNTVDVVWAAFDTGPLAYVMAHRRFIDDEWQSLTEVYMSYNNISDPSVGNFTEYPYDGLISAAFEVNHSFSKVFQFDGEEWKQVVSTVSGINPTMSGAGDQLVLYTTENTVSAPYQVLHLQVEPSEGGQSLEKGRYVEGDGKKVYRIESLELTDLLGSNSSGIFQARIEDVFVTGFEGFERVGFSRSDTLLNVNGFLQTKPILVNHEVEGLKFNLLLKGGDLILSDSLATLNSIRIIVREVQSGQILTTLNGPSLSTMVRLADRTFVDSIEIDLRPMEGKKVVLTAEPFYHGQFDSLPMNQAEVFEFNDGLGKNSGPFALSITIPEDYLLGQNYPNPFNPETTIRFQLPESQQVALRIYDIQGRLVRVLAAHTFEAGEHQLRWDGRNDQGVSVASGVYFYRFQAGEYIQTKKMMLMR